MKKNLLFTICCALLMGLLATFVSFSGENLAKIAIFVLFALPFSFFRLKFDGENITISLELIPIYASFFIFNNPYLGTAITIVLFLLIDIIIRTRYQDILRRIFLLTSTMLLSGIIFKKFSDAFLFLTLQFNVKRFLLFGFLVVFCYQVLNFLYLTFLKKLNRIVVFRSLAAMISVTLILYVFQIGYILFWDKMQIPGVLLFCFIFISIIALVQTITNYYETKRKYRLLLSMMGKVIEKNTLDEQLHAIIDSILSLYRIHFISIWLTDHEKKTNILKICKPAELLLDRLESLPLGEGLVGKSVESKQIIYIPDVYKDPNYYEGVRGIHSELTIPLIYKETVIGLIDLESNEKYYFNQFLIDLFSELSKQLSLIIFNSVIRDRLAKQSSQVGDLAKNVQEIALEVKDSSSKIELELNMANESLSRSLMKNEEIRNRLNAVSKKEKEIDTNIEKIDGNISQNVGISKRTNERFIETMGTLENIFNMIKESHTKVNALFENLENINVIMKKLTEISERTNILSFNAAIEAARAGELGKGFAVVANNIKELVNKSEGNIRDTSGIINGIKNIILELDNIFKSQIDVSANANQMVNNLKSNIEKLIDDSSKESSNFQRQLGDIKNTIGEFTAIIGEISQIDNELEELKSKNNEVVNKSTFLTQKIEHLENTAENLMKMMNNGN